MTSSFTRDHPRQSIGRPHVCHIQFHRCDCKLCTCSIHDEAELPAAYMAIGNHVKELEVMTHLTNLLRVQLDA